MFKKVIYLLVMTLLVIFMSIIITNAQEVPVHEKLSHGFVKLNNDLAVAIVKLEKNNEYKSIMATVAIKKLSPSDLEYPLRGEHAIITLDLIDDQGEIFSTDHDLNYIEEYLYCLPKGFVFTEEFSTSAPLLAFNHIKTINILGHEVNLVELDLGSLESTDLIIHATERVQISKWLDFKIDGIIDNKLKDFKRFYLKGTIMNSSYDDKGITITLVCQDKDGKLFNMDGGYYEIGGKSYKVFVLSLGSSVKIENVRACLTRPNPYEEGALFVLPIHDKIPFFYPPTINYIGSLVPKCLKISYDDPPRLERRRTDSTHLCDFVWETEVRVQRVKRYDYSSGSYKTGDYYKITVAFDKGEGSLITGVYSQKGNFIESGGHSPGAFFTYKRTIVIPGEATNSNLHVEETEEEVDFYKLMKK